MPKLLTKITIAALAIAATSIGTFYLTSVSRDNSFVSSNHSAVATENIAQATLVNPKGYLMPYGDTHSSASRSAYVWDKETEPNYLETTEVTVYRSPSCGCCGMWIQHAQNHGFKVEDIKTEEMEAVKQKYNIPPELASCHTTIIDGYVMEGHIPADDIKNFLAQKPDNFVGLTVPGMPIGTPGMETRDIKQPFQVLAFDANGEVKVFKEYQSY